MAESVESIIRRVWQAAGLDPDLGVATAVQESGLRYDAVGDGGKSHGVFQEHDAGRGHGLPIAARQDVEAASRRAASEFRQMLAKHPGATPGQIAAYAQRPLNAGTYARNIDANLGRMKQGMSALDAAAGGVGKGGTSPPAPERGQGVVAAGVRQVSLPPTRAPIPKPPGSITIKAGRGTPMTGDRPGVTVVKGPRARTAPAISAAGGQRGAPQQVGERFWPIVGVRPGGVNNPFGAQQFRSSGAEGLALPATNTGADLTAPYGATIVAEMDGVVTEVYQATGDSKRGGRNPKENGGWGGSVIVNYADGTKARYSHQAAGSVQVRPGQRVVGGQMIGQVGDSGNATGPHVDAMFWNAQGQLSDIVKAGKWTPGRVTVGPEGQALPPGQAGKATNVALPKPAQAAPQAQARPAQAVQNDPAAMAAYEAWKKTAGVPNVPPAPMPQPTPAGGPPPAPMPEIGGPPPEPVEGPVPGTELLRAGQISGPNTMYNFGLDPKLVEETQARIDAAAAGTGSTVVPMGQGVSTRRPAATAAAAEAGSTTVNEDERQQGNALGTAVRQAGQPSGATSNPLGGIGDFFGKAGATIQAGVDAIRARNPGGAATPAAGAAGAAGTAPAPQPPAPVQRTPDAVPNPETDSPALVNAKLKANAANKALYDFQDTWNKAAWLLQQAGGAVPPVDPDKPDTPETLALREAQRIVTELKDPKSATSTALQALRNEQEQWSTKLGDAQTGNPEDLAKSRGQKPPGSATQGRTITDPSNGQVLVEQPDGSWRPVGGTKPPTVSVHSGADGLYVTDDGGNLINQIPIPKDGNPVVLAGGDGPELLIYDPSDGSIVWQPNRSFLNTPQEVRATSKDKYIVTQDKVTGAITATPNPGFDPRATDSVTVSSTGRAIRIGEDGKLVSSTDTLTPEERLVYDKRSQAESGQAVTKAASDKFKLEQEQKEAEEWQRIEEAVNAGATPAEVRGLVMQAAKNVQDFTALQNAETSRQTQMETGRHNLAEEGFSERQRRTAETGEARAGVAGYQMATAPFQTAMLASLSQVTDPRKAAQGMNIAPNVFEPVGAKYDEQQARQKTIDTQRQGVVEAQAQPFTAPYKKPGTSPAPAAAATASPVTAAPGADYAAPSATAQPSTQASPAQRTETGTVDLESEGKPGYARTTYSDGTSQEWQIPLPEQAAEAPPEQPFQPTPEEDDDDGGYFVGGGGGQLPPLYIPRRQRSAIQSTASGPAGGGGSQQAQQGRRTSKRRRLPVEGKHIIPLDGDWFQTHYDDGAVETWHRSDGSAYEGLGGGGAGFHGEDPPVMGTYGWEHGTGGGGGSIWTIPPPASVSVGYGAQMALEQPDPTRDRNGGGMAGGFAGPQPVAGGGGAYGAQQSQNGQAQAPMWDAATPAPFATSGVSGTSGVAGQSTLYQPGASAGTGAPRFGASNVPATTGGGSRVASPTTGYYGGPAMPQAMSPLQRLLQQTGVVPTSAGRAAGSPGTV